MKKYVHVIIGVIIFLVLALALPRDMGMTQAGILTLATMVMAIYFWLTIGIGWTSLLALGLCCVFGSLGTSGAILANSFGSTPVAFAMTIIILNNALNDCGITERIANFFITRKIIQGRPWMFIFMFCLSCWVIGLFIDISALVILYIGLSNSILTKMGYEKGSTFGRALYMGMLVSAVISTGATPIGHVVPAIMMSIAAATTGTAVSVLSYCLIGVPTTFICLCITMLVLKLFIRVDVSKYVAYTKENAIESAELKPINRDAIITTIIYLCVIALWIIPDVIKGIAPTVAGFLSAQGVVVPCIFAIVILCLIPKKGEKQGILTYESAIQRVPWTLALFAGTIMMFSTLINAETTGINVFLINLFSPITSAITNPVVLIAIGVLVTIILTNFISNAVAQTVVFTVVASALMATGADINISAIAVLIAIGAEIAFMTPAAAPAVPFAYNEGYIKVADGIKYGFPIAVICWVVLCIFWPIASMIV